MDVFIALFGFIGLILVFTFRNLLATKGQLEKETIETSLKIPELQFMGMRARMRGQKKDSVMTVFRES